MRTPNPITLLVVITIIALLPVSGWSADDDKTFSQAELDQIIARSVGRKFTRENRVWYVVNEEFHDDPLTEYVAPPRPYVGGRDIFLFVDAGDDLTGADRRIEIH